MNPKSVCLTEGYKSLVEADEILHALGEYHDGVLFPDPLPEDAVLTPAMIKMALMQAEGYVLKLREAYESLRLRAVEIQAQAEAKAAETPEIRH